MKLKLLMIIAMLTTSASVWAQKQNPTIPDEGTTSSEVAGDVYTVTLPAKNGMDEQTFDMILVKERAFPDGSYSRTAHG